MPDKTDFQREMESEDRKEWLKAEYARLMEEAKPHILRHDKLAAEMKVTDAIAEDIARQAFGILLAQGFTERGAAKEILKWRKQEG